MNDRELLLKAIKGMEDLGRFIVQSHENQRKLVQELLEESGGREIGLMVRVMELSNELKKALHGKDKT